MPKYRHPPDAPPLPVIFVWACLVLGAVCYGGYDRVVDRPKQETMKGTHLSGWRLDEDYRARDGLFYDRLEEKECTTKRYAGYPPCPAQQYFIDGTPQESPR